MADLIRHETIAANGVRLHHARLGAGRPLVLLHGWPEFWLTWEPLMRRLADRFDLIAPDLRGFGDSPKPDEAPSDGVGPEVHAADLLALLDHLGEIWYQFFHQKPWAAALVGSSREACRIYFGNMLRHWAAGNPSAFDGEVLEAWVDNFLKPGNLQGGFDWYLSRNRARMAAIRGDLPPEPPVTVPTRVRWGALDPVLKVEWLDRLGDSFTELDAAPFQGVGHFPHREAPDRAAAEIADWFGQAGA
jgi:pimeloyl-ACP methyl ester carboxylesterase